MIERRAHRNDLNGVRRARVDALAALARRLGGDELDVLVLIARRLDVGRARYGALHVRQDRRDFPGEAVEELADAAVYLAAAVLRRRRRGAG